jgi:putative hydrolase
LKHLDRQNKNPGLIFPAKSLDFSNIPRVDSHLHTSWTDGEAKVKEVYENAVEKKITTVLFSEHSRKTSTDWFPLFANEVRSLPSIPCKAYVGTEVKVESLDGDIDTVPAISDLCDFVMASVHRFVDSNGCTLQFDEVDPHEAADIEFQMSWAVLNNPGVDILGHIFGMSFKRFNITPSDDKICKLISRAAELGVAIEVNSHYHPNPLKIAQWCSDFNANMTFGSNAHSLENVGSIMKHFNDKV